MKTLRLILVAFALAPLALDAQTQNVQQDIPTKRLKSDITIPSGKTATFENGSTLSVSSGTTVDGLLSASTFTALSTGLMRVETGTGALSSISTSLGLLGNISDETGTGSLVFSTSPSLVTPSLGVASGTSFNKITLTAPATGATLTLADGKVFTVSSTLTLSGTDSTSFAFPSGSGTVATLDATQTLTNKTLTSPTINSGNLVTPALGVAAITSATFPEAAAPSTPASASVILYAKSDGLLYSKDDAGAETLVSGGSGGGGGMTNPMTTAEDIIVGGSSGTPTRKAKGSEGQVLKIVSGAVAWDTDSTGSGSLPASPTTGDLTYFDGANWVSRAIGTSGQVLKVSSGLPTWGTGGDVTGPSSATATRIATFSGTSGKVIQDASSITADNNQITFAAGTVGAPPTNYRLGLYGSDYSIGINANQMWFYAGDGAFRFFTNGTNYITFSQAGSIVNTITTASTDTTSGSIINAGGIGNAGVIYTRMPVVPRASDLSVSATATNAFYTNESTSTKVEFTLPAAAANLYYTFIVQDSDGIRVTAASGDSIRIAGTVSAAAGYVEATTIGNTLTLISINATEWIAVASNGTWTFGP